MDAPFCEFEPREGNRISRRNLLALGAGALLLPGSLASAAPKRRPRVAAIYTICTHRSHGHVILENFLGPYLFNGKKTDPGVDVVSIYADQQPAGDMTPAISKEYGIPVFQSIDEALCVGGNDLAVDAVLSIGEHGSYPRTKLGQTMYPRKRFFDEIVATMKRSRRFVPVFNDKHLSYHWDEGLAMYQTATQLGIPFMAGSSVPLATRRPALELPPDQVIDEAVAIHGGPLESYGFHGLELLQSMVESRKGGETGIASVEFLQGEEVWNAAKAGRWSIDLAKQAMIAELGEAHLKSVPNEQRDPNHAFLVKYRDGTKGVVLRVGHNSTRWNFACRMKGQPKIHATAFYVGPWENRNLFKALSHAIQHHFIHGAAPYPVERTLIVTGALEAAMRATQQPGQPLRTPHLEMSYKPLDYRAMREMGETWKILTPEVPQPSGIHRFGKE